MRDALAVLEQIARGYVVSPTTGRLQTLTRDEMTTMAREVCDRHGVSYAQSDLGVQRAYERPRKRESRPMARSSS
jgi:hypothetical protein